MSANVEPVRAGKRSRVLLFLLLAGTATAVQAQERPGPGQDPSGEPNEIVVIGILGLFADVVAERSLDDEDVSAYGVSTIDALLGEVGVETADREEPVILINGERVENLDDIGGYPVEAVERLEVFPRGSGARVGGSPQQRVYSLTLRNSVRSLALAGAYRSSTGGKWSARRGEAILTRIRGQDRLNITFRARHEDDLLEIKRGILQPSPVLPYDLLGNVIGDPRGADPEIDPALSALAGTVVTRAAVPGHVSSPGLADFAAGASRVNETDIGRYRTLVPESEGYDLNLSMGNRLAPWLRSSVNARLNWSDNRSLLGLPSAAFVLPSASIHSPFGRDVGLAAYGADPLAQRYSSFNGTANGTLNANAKGWLFTLSGNVSHARRRVTTERQDFALLSQALLLDPTRNPFTGGFADLLPVMTDQTRSTFDVGTLQLRATGSPFAMPAGPARMTVGSSLTLNRLTARRSLASGLSTQRFRRNERSAFVSGELPLTSRRNEFLPWLGDLSANFELAVVDLSDFASFTRRTVGLGWTPVEWLRLFASTSVDRQPPNSRLLGNPLFTTQGVRYLDVLTGDTVDVVQISGGNPLLVPERTSTDRLGFNASPMPRINLQINAELSSTRTRNPVAELPPASAAIMLAFPERFIRDASGSLATVDIRPVNLERQREDHLRYGFSLAVPIGPAPAPGRAAASDDSVSIPDGDEGFAATSGGGGPRPRLQVSFAHAILLGSEVLIRPGLPKVDLLDGGAIGLGGGSPRHRLNANVTASARGIGASLSGIWQSASELVIGAGGGTDRLRFSPYSTLNLRAFVEGRRVFPKAEWMRGTRLSLSVVNLLDKRQSVFDSSRGTPLPYQPAYRDPLGRTVELELRKTF